MDDQGAFAARVAEQRLLVAVVDGAVVGYLAYGWLWDQLPTIYMLRISNAPSVALHESLGFAVAGDLVVLPHERELWWLRALSEPGQESLPFVPAADDDYRRRATRTR